jgi:hypothetical protein
MANVSPRMTPDPGSGGPETDIQLTGLHGPARTRALTIRADVCGPRQQFDAYEGGLPSARYLGILADAAEVAGAPGDYVTWLRERPCASPGG